MDYRTKLSNYFCQRNRGFVLSLLVAVCLIYLPFLSSPFFFDDLNFFSGNIPSNYAHSPFHFSLRWLPYASLGWTWVLFLDASHLFHLGNALLHAANVVLLFFLLRQFIRLTAPANQKISYSDWGAWLGALFFACNPVAVYAVGYVIQRSILLATLFTLAMQLAYLHGLINGQKRWLALSLLFYFLAVFSKEHSLMAPAIVIAITILLRSHIRADWRALWATWLGYLVIGVFVVLRAKGVFGVAYEHDAAMLFEQQDIAESSATLHLLSVFTQAGLFFKYLFLWWLPNPAWMSVDMRETFVSAWTAWQGWLKAAGFMLYGVLACRLLLRRGRTGLVGLALLYPWLLFSVEFSSIRVQEPFVLYRSYLWLPGMLLLIPLLVEALPNRKHVVVALTISTLLLVPLSWNRLWVFADGYRLWNDAALLLKNEHIPGAARIYYNRGNAELASKQWPEAIADYQRVITIDPKIEQSYANIGVAHFNLKHYAQAITAFDQAIALSPAYALAYFGKGMSLKRLHSDAAAMAAMKKSCELGNVAGCLISSSRRN
ncbi:MAG: tetratricopeptide repeat protein [Methylophilaceae bacterium]